MTSREDGRGIPLSSTRRGSLDFARDDTFSPPFPLSPSKENNVTRTITWIFIALLLPIQALADHRLYPNWIVEEHQPNLQQGGRANTIAVNPDNRAEMFVASDSGGLFKTSNAGFNWSHVDELEATFTQSVVYVNANILLVSAKADFRNGGGVWRGLRNGSTWTWTKANLPVTRPGFDGRLSAFEISTLVGIAVVATSEGLFASVNNGATWTWSSPFDDPNQTEDLETLTVNAVLLTPAEAGTGGPFTVYAGGPAGIRIGTVPLGAWEKRDGSPGGIRGIHSFGSSPVARGHAFVANGHLLFVTEDRGLHWTHIPAPPDAVCGGDPFIKAVRRGAFLDLYYGNRCGLHRAAAPVNGTTVTYPDHPDDWQQLPVFGPDPDNPRDLAVFETRPVLLATNAGLYDTVDGGATWHDVGGGRLGGYNALQVAELKGQIVSGTTALYLGTRDNGLVKTNVWGNGPVSQPPSGLFLEAQRSVSSPEVTFQLCPACPPRLSTDGLVTAPPFWPNAPSALRTAPVLVGGDRYVQNVQSGLSMTDDDGASWPSTALFSVEPRGLPRLARAGTGDRSTMLYQAFRSSRQSVGSAGPNRLMRVHFFQSTGLASFAFMDGFGNLGFNPALPLAVYPVFGVDSLNPNHVIAPDVRNGKMKVTTNGGNDWSEMTNLTAQVTQGGRSFQAKLDGLPEPMPLVTAISFHPTNPQLVLLGTSDGGIYYSGNRGLTWGPIAGSKLATHVTSFFWETANRVYVSTWGRGMWVMRNWPVAGPEDFDDFCDGCDVVSMDGRPGPSFDGAILVFDGRLLGVRTEDGQIRKVFVTYGSSVIFTGDPKDPQQDIEITESDDRDPSQYEPLPEPPKGWLTTGAVFTAGDMLEGAVFAESELSMHPEESHEDVKGSSESPSAGLPYIRLTTSASNGAAAVVPREVFELSATGLIAGKSYEVLIDGVALEGDIAADGKGAFTTSITAPPELGYHSVEVRMMGDETVLDGSTFLVTSPN
jgi:hypothetical protein